MQSSAERAIAIVGVGAILPDAPSAPAFWDNIVNKRYSITEVPPERWSIGDYYDPDPKAVDKTYSKIGGWVRGFAYDWKRFRMPPKVAAAMDEGQQWAVTIAADALADYGYPQRALNTENTAVILGTAMGGELHYITHLRIAFPEYANALEEISEFSQLPADLRQTIVSKWRERIGESLPPITEDTMPGELPNIVSGRVANVLNLRGPNFITDAACASSFAAVNAAVELLSEHQVDAVVAGGVDRNMGVSTFVKFCKIGALSPTGSRPFGAGADGFVMGEGSAAFVLKRLEDAERNGDKIYAVIRGVGGSSDGKGKGITAPNPVGQELAIERAWRNAELDPATATLVEAHGTSTRVGDVVEVESLAKVFGTAGRQRIGLGSAKSNIGHLKAGAGAAGLLKATMALHHKVLPPTLNAQEPNPNIDFTNGPFYLVHEAQEWQRQNGTPRRCGVSAYGFGGTNFHLVLEEHVPGMIRNQAKQFAAAVPTNGESNRVTAAVAAPANAKPAPLRGILAISATTPKELKDKLDAVVQRVEGGWLPPRSLPKVADVKAAERLIIDFGDADELLDRVHKARKVMGFDNPQAWKAVEAQGIFRGSGRPTGKTAYLFPGQGSQYVNMGRELVELSPTVAEVFAEADKVMTPILGRPLTDYIFVDAEDSAAVNRATFDLMQTEITQPAMLTLDMAIYKLLADYGFKPDMVMGHSLGEYAALIAAGIMPFSAALEAAAARGSEMSKVSVDDNGKMAAVLAPFDVIEETLSEVGGYVVPANINSQSQCVIGGASEAVERACQVFEEKGYRALILPVSHAFHTKIVAPASAPLRQVLDRLDIRPPELPLVANVTGAFYPQTVEGIKGILEKQIASPVQWVKGLETLYEAGVRCFVEAGPKRALRGFVRDVFKDNDDVLALMTNHPKGGTLPTFNQALCALYAAGYTGEADVAETTDLRRPASRQATEPPAPVPAESMLPAAAAANGSSIDLSALGAVLAQALQQAGVQNNPAPQAQDRYDTRQAPPGSVVISGTGLGLPGAEKPVMDPDNALRILRGEQFVDLIPERFRKRMVNKNITRLVKAADGGGSFEFIGDTDEVIKLAGRAGSFDLEAEYGVPAKLVEALDITTQLAMAAGLDALREAGIPLVQTFRKTTTGKMLPDRWLLPESLRDETGVIFASAFPGGQRFADEFSRYYTWQTRVNQLEMLEDLRQYTTDQNTLQELNRRIAALRGEMEREPYIFDRRFLFRILSMGHSQFAQYIGARGPNAHVNAACASTAQGIALAEDWIKNGRCRRVIVIGADDVTGNDLMEWVGAGFLAVGAVTTEDRVDEAALPFDRRRHGTILGMGACGLVVESEDAVRERGMRGIVELLSSETSNSAFHGTRLDVNHIAIVMDNLVTTAERRFGLNRYGMAPQTVFMSHETYTPARGGSASAEVVALRETFGEAASDIIVANTKGFTGHPMGVGVEDVIAVKILEHGIVPPVPNFKEVDPELGPLNLSRGGRYPVQYAIHLAAGFGSQIAMTLTRRIPGSLNRIDNSGLYNRWLADISGYNRAETEVVQRVLRVKSDGAPPNTPAPSTWEYGTGPSARVQMSPNGAGAGAGQPARRPILETQVAPPPPPPAPAPAPEPVKVQTAPPAMPRPEPKPVKPVQVETAPAATPEPAPVAPPPPEAAPAAASATAPEDPVVSQVISLVAGQTGYPEDMLDLDLDLEADLGVDTVKQAETFLAIREAFDIPRRDDLNLRDYNTLEKVIGFVKDMRPDLAAATPAAPASEPAPPLPTPAAPAVVPTLAEPSDPVARRVIGLVAEQTGYPEDMLDLDLDLEADLGVDTVKQAETFLAIREAFDIPRRDDLNLRDYNTLEKVIGFVREMRPDLEEAAPAPPSPEPVAAVLPSPPHATSTDDIRDRVIGIVAEQTGYPEDMLDLDLDLEADLGVDTVKQAETFLAIRQEFNIPRRDDLNLRDYNTLEKVIGFVKDMRPDLAATAPPAAAPIAAPTPAAAAMPAPPPPAAPVSDPVAERVLAIVAEQTGYPEDMLELDLDLEADLGVDTVKQAETFVAIREAFDIPRRDDLNLRDYNTLEKVIGFVHEMRPDLAAAAAPVAKAAPPPAPQPAAAPSAADTSTDDPVAGKVLAIVAEQTGYPEDMLELDLDLEADLGVDTVKQAETFVAIREEFDIPRRDDLNLRDYNTLEKVIGFVHEMRPDLAAPAPVMAEAAAPETAPLSAPPARDGVAAKVLAIVAEQTGYPEDMLELDLDLEADLGVDTVKQAETFVAIREEFNIPRRDDLNLRDYNTLEKVIGFVHEMRPELAASAPPAVETAAADAAIATPAAPQAEAKRYKLGDADKMPRRVPMPSLRPALALCKETGVLLDENSRVVVMPDRGGVARSLVSRLEKLGVTILQLDPEVAEEAIEGQIETWLADGPVQGVYWLPALDAEPELEAMSFQEWREATSLRVKKLYRTMRALYESVSGTNSFLISGTRLGGLHGYGTVGATAPLGGAVTGFTKAYKRERGDVLVKAVDFEASRKTAAPAEALIAETLSDPGVVEVGYYNDNRYTVTLVEMPAADGGAGVVLDRESVFVVTGAAGGITSEIVGDLAANSGGIFYLLDLVAEPARDDEKITLFRQDKEALKRLLIEEAKAAGERPTPVLIDKRIMSIERDEAALRAIEAVEAAGGTVHYHSVNLLDHEAVSVVVADIRERYGRIDVLVHAGGIEISRSLPDKDAQQFALVFDIKADGFFSLLKAAEGMPIGATVSFSSVAGRFGNNGQADYSAANDLLCKITSSFREWRPETKGIAIDWTAWGGIGMATRGSIPKIMEMAGIDMLPPEAGVPTVRRELVAGGFKGEIVTGGVLGILVEEWDETGGLDVEKANAWLQEKYGNLLMVGQIKAAQVYGGLAVETTLDPQAQPFLYDHAPDEGTPWLPGVMATEALAETATVLVDGYHVAAVENEVMSGAFKFFRNEPRTLYLNASARPGEENEIIVSATLRSVTPPARDGLPTREQVHFAANVRMVPGAPDAVAIDFEPPAAETLPTTAEEIYKVFFHGPAYQVIERIKVAGERVTALMPADMPPNSAPAAAQTLMAPRLVELCFQAAAQWSIETKEAMAFPLGIGALTAYQQPDEAEGRRLWGLVTTADDGESFDGQVVDEVGNVFVDLKGYRTVSRPATTA